MTYAWTSSPSPPLDALSSESSSSSAFLVGWQVALTLPRHLWDAYVTYLWYYQPNSWVGRLASTFRILAVMLVLPVILLTLLDVTSYVIARTLGVVDDVKASTIDSNTTTDARNKIGVAVPVAARVPTMTCACPSFSSSSTSPSTSTTSSSLSHGVGVGGPVREGLAPEDSVERLTDGDGDGRSGVSETTAGTSVAASVVMHAHAHAQTIIQSQIQSQIRMRSANQDASDASPRAYYFTGEEDLRLAGEGVFSPAVSMPPSPLTPRMPLHTFTESDGREVGQVSEEGIVLKRRVQSARENELGHT